MFQTPTENRTVFSSYDVDKYTKGASKECGLHSQTIQAISAELVTRRKQFKKAKLRWRVSNPKSAKKSLGWIPFKKSAIKYQNGQIKYGAQWFSLWDSYGLSEYNVRLVHLFKMPVGVGMPALLLIPSLLSKAHQRQASVLIWA